MKLNYLYKSLLEKGTKSTFLKVDFARHGSRREAPSRRDPLICFAPPFSKRSAKQRSKVLFTFFKREGFKRSKIQTSLREGGLPPFFIYCVFLSGINKYSNSICYCGPSKSLYYQLY